MLPTCSRFHQPRRPLRAAQEQRDKRTFSPHWTNITQRVDREREEGGDEARENKAAPQGPPKSDSRSSSSGPPLPGLASAAVARVVSRKVNSTSGGGGCTERGKQNQVLPCVHIKEEEAPRNNGAAAGTIGGGKSKEIGRKKKMGKVYGECKWMRVTKARRSKKR